MVLKFTISRSVLSYLWSMELPDVSIDAFVALAKQKQTGMWPMPNVMADLPNIGGASVQRRKLWLTLTT